MRLSKARSHRREWENISDKDGKARGIEKILEKSSADQNMGLPAAPWPADCHAFAEDRDGGVVAGRRKERMKDERYRRRMEGLRQKAIELFGGDVEEANHWWIRPNMWMVDRPKTWREPQMAPGWPRIS
jgi:hypothetical protein